MDLGLENRVAIVTGGSKGMGLAVATGLASHGARVCIVARDPEILDEAAAAIRGRSETDVLAIPGDVRDPKLPERTVGEVMGKWGRLDILVNNAGGPPPGSFLEHSDEAWEDALQLNLLSTIRFTRAAIPIMKERNWGRILNITSSLAKEPTPMMVLSATARAGVSAFSKAIATELAPHGITVNTVCPGGVKTDRLVSLFNDLAKKQDTTAKELIEQAEANIPIGRFADPEEFAQILLFLASEKGGYVTGTSIVVDGGLTKSIF